VGTVLALAVLPFVLVLAAAVAIALRTSPLFVQRRYGRNGRVFPVIKLRTLPHSTPHFASKHELDWDRMGLPWVCRFLRRTHLDELPQLFLVPIGVMSLVGPRPRMLIGEPVDESFHELRTAVRPGCTGLWQISVAKHETATANPRFDMFYLRHAGFRLDAWIIIRTVGVVLGLCGTAEVDDVPAWVRGRGLLPASAFIMSVAPRAIEAEPPVAAVAAEAIGVDSAVPLLVPMPSPAPEPQIVTALPVAPARTATSSERLLAEA
jgi:lipopolysaccharide/colanic/teichoic acid biosynthesis glycosyltransferase